MRNILSKFDASVTNFIASWPTNLHGFFAVVTAFGDPLVTLGIGISVIGFGIFKENLRLAIAGGMILVTIGVGFLLKLVFSRQRPISDYVLSMRFDSFSFPSGHTTGATITYGLLAYLAWQFLPQPWNFLAIAGLIGLIIAVGVSRIYLGAHFPSDVVAGWLLGAIGVLLIVLIIKPQL